MEREDGLEFVDAGGEAVNGLTFGIGEAVVGEHLALVGA